MSRYEGASTEKANIIGVDLAKPVFQVHGACRDGSVAFRKKISRQNCFRSYRLSRSVWCDGGLRRRRCLGAGCSSVGPRSAPDRAGLREARRQKNDMADAEAITEAAVWWHANWRPAGTYRHTQLRVSRVRTGRYPADRQLRLIRGFRLSTQTPGGCSPRY